MKCALFWAVGKYGDVGTGPHPLFFDRQLNPIASRGWGTGGRLCPPHKYSSVLNRRTGTFEEKFPPEQS